MSALWHPLATPTILLGFPLPWVWGISSRLLQQSAATAPYLGQGVSPHRHPSWPSTWDTSSRPSCACADTAPSFSKEVMLRSVRKAFWEDWLGFLRLFQSIQDELACVIEALNAVHKRGLSLTVQLWPRLAHALFLHVSLRRNWNHNPLPLGPPLFISCHYFFFSLVDFSFSFVSYLKVGVLTGVPLGFPEGPVFIGLHYSNYPSSKVQSASAFNTGSPLHNLLLLESPSVSCYQRKTGKIACLYGLLFLSPNPWDLCLALPHRMLTIKSNS